MASSLHCPDCHARFAVDQRYCTECGRRLRPIPRPVAATLATMAGSSARRVAADRLNATPEARGGALTSTAGGGHSVTVLGTRYELPSPRALVVAVLMVMAFGVIISSGNTSLANSPFFLTFNRPVTSAAVVTTPLATSSPSTGNTGSGGNTGGGTVVASTGGGGSSTPTSSATTTTTTPAATTTPGEAAGLPPIEHVWVIELGDQAYAQTFENSSTDTYLNSTLAKQGEVVPYVYASATSDLANEVGLISGQGPTVQTEDNCPQYTAIKPGTLADKQVTGSGCVYPKSTPSLMSELTAAGFTWKAYIQGLGTTAATSCTHPSLGSSDTFFAAKTNDGYVTWRNPFVYLAGITSVKSSCDSDDTGVGALADDLKTEKTTPNISFILPNSCDDGSDTPCRPGAPAGTAQSDKFLKTVVPKIMASAAYKKDGMILITFAQAPQSGPHADQSSCCDAPTQFPNLPSANYVPPSATTTTATGTTSVGTTGTGTTDTTGTTTTGTTTTTACPSTTTDSTPTATDSTTSTTDTTTAVGTDCACPTATDTTTTPTDSTTATTTTGTDTTASCVTCPSTSTATTTTGTDTTTPVTDTTATGTTATGTTDTTDTTAACTGTGTTTTPVELGPGIPTGGGGDVGMLVLSQYVSKDLQDGEDGFSTFSITASLEQLFGLKYTGYAATSGLPLFSGFLYSHYNDG